MTLCVISFLVYFYFGSVCYTAVNQPYPDPHNSSKLLGFCDDLLHKLGRLSTDKMLHV